ncbi:MAG: oxaloacetate decarboxylase [Thermoanaerobacteraceae bacterium]|nr:oxaloacetate decarboxylase [Thermoanaerobacteraceae bacterium]
MSQKIKALRQLLKDREIIIVPGASTALLARIIEDIGFDAVYATGAGISNMNFGFPDVGLTTMNEILEACKRINDAVNLPVIADIDNGYGNPLNVYRTVKEFSRAGMAAIQIEDQVSPKRCGHFEGKDVISPEEMVYKIKAARDAGNDVVIIARTDSIAVNGFEDAIERAGLYAENGADMIFVEAPRNIEELRKIPENITVPCVANMVEGGKTPIISADELSHMGYKMVIYANLSLRAAVKAAHDALLVLKEEGSSTYVMNKIITMDERNMITKLHEVVRIERRYGIRE